MTAGGVRRERWRSLAGLLRAAAGRRRTAALAALVLAAGVLPSAVVLATGALVHAIPGAMAHGLGAPAGQPALRAGAALVLALAALSLARHALAQLARVLDAAFAREVHHAVARVTLGSPGLAPLEDPALADELEAVEDAERRDVLRQAVTALASVATARLRGMGAFVLLLGFHWWAPLLLAAAWHLTHRLYLRTIENGVSVGMSGGAVRLRRAEYLRSLAMDAPAAKEVRVFALGDWLVERYADAWLQALGEIWRSRRAGRALTVAAVVALGASHAAVLGALGAAALGGQVGAAALLVFAQAVIATHDLGIVGDWQWYLAQALALSGRVARMRARVPGALPLAERAAPGRWGSTAVRLEGVRFTYPGRERPTLDGLTLHVPAGQSLAIVGENGAGKSTLIKLLCGLYEPDAGNVTLDGGATPLEARGRIGAIFQEFVRYPLPLRENVAFGHLPLLGDPAALDGAMRGAGAAGVLARLPAGWDTVLSREFDGGADLSGGQWQRVALARALAAVQGGAGLLILDEPTAALDVKGETELFERFLDLTRDVTTILVSHRLSSVRRADRIVVIEGGRVVEDGTHAQLMRRGGRYAAMFTLQAERFGPGAADGEVAHV